MSKKIKNRMTVFFLSLQIIFSLFLPLQPLVHLAQAQEISDVHFSKNESLITVSNSKASKFSYFFRANDTNFNSIGTVSNDSFSIDLKSQSGEDESIFEVERLVLKTDLNSYFLEIAGNKVTVAKEYQADSLELDTAEANFLLNVWQIDTSARKATTSDNVVLNQEYSFPLNEDVRVTFTSLPEKTSPLSIQEVQLTAEQQQMLGAVSAVAYDVTTEMTDGEFTFDLVLPKTEISEEVKVKYAESVDELDSATAVEEKVEVQGEEVKVSDLDHMTLFIVVKVLDLGITLPFDGPDDNVGDVWTYRSVAGADSDLINNPTSGLPEHLGNQVVEMNAPGLGRSFLGYTGFSWEKLSSTNLTEISWYKYAADTNNDHYLNFFIYKGLDRYGSVSIVPTCSAVGLWEQCSTNGASINVRYQYYSTSGWPWTWGWKTVNQSMTSFAQLMSSEFANWSFYNDTDTNSSLVLVSGSSTTPSNLLNYVDGVRFVYAGGSDDFYNFEAEPDLVAPTVSFIPSAPGLINQKTWTTDINFSETVNELLSSELALTNATVRTFSQIDGSHYTVELEAVSDGTVTLQVPADVVFDQAGHGNSMSEVYSFDVDVTKPIVAVTSPMVGSYHKNPVMIAGTATDVSSGVKSVALHIYRINSDGSKTLVSGCTSLPGILSGNDWSLLINNGGSCNLSDDHYEIAAWAYDNANNPGWAPRVSFYVDNTFPTKPTGLKFLSQDRTKEFSCGKYLPLQVVIPDWDDISGDPSFAHFEYTSFHPSGAIGLNEQVLTVSELNNSWMPPADGVYGYSVRSVDKAGNKSEWALLAKTLEGSCQVIYDSVVPTVSINPLLINDKTPALNGTWTENIQLEKIEVTVGGQTKDATINSDHTWVLADNQLAALADGIYDVQVKATDMAGNVGNDTTNDELKIDSVAPTAKYAHYIDGIIFGGTKAYVKNINQLKFSGTYDDVLPSSGLLKDSFVIFQAQNDGSFRFSQNGKLAYCGWRNPANTLPISGGVLNDIAFANCKADLGEGEYYLAHQVYDNAIRWDNPSITQFRDVLGLHFVVDQTKPTVTADVSPGSPDGANGWYITQPIITLSASDAALDKVEYHWDSDVWSTYSNSLTLANEGMHTLYYRAIDLAGNISDEGSLTLKWDGNNPSVPILTWPIAGEITNDNTPLMQWDNSIDNIAIANYYYRVYYNCSNLNNSSTCSSVWPNANGLVRSISEYQAGVSADRVYYWQVKAVDTAGNESVWSDLEKVTIDTIVPTLNKKTPFSGWYNTDQVSSFDFSDAVSATLSGLPVTCTISAEGLNQTCNVSSPHVCDEAGNCYTSLLTSNGANIDKTAPSSIIASPGDGTTHLVYTNSWTGLISGTAADTLGATDASGVNKVWLSIQRGSGDEIEFWNGSAWATGTEETVRVLANGTDAWDYTLTNPAEDSYTIISHAKDGAGNVENSYELTIIFDKTIPEVNLSIDPTDPDGKNGWYNTQPTITLTATDANFDHIEYQWDGQADEAWVTYVDPIKPSSEGHHILYYRASDLANNMSDTGIKNLAWDQTELTEGPLKVDATPDRSGGPDAKVTWEAATDNVGIDHYKVTFDLLNGDADFSQDVASHIRELTTNKLTEAGTWRVTVTAYDGASHEKSASDEIVIDKTAPAAPTLTLDGTGPGSVDLSWTKVDEADEYIILYGVNDGQYLYAARVGNVLSYTVQGLTAGNYYFVVRAEDGSGNQSSNSNQVSTLSLLAAPGGGGQVAQGFTEAAEVTQENPAKNDSNGETAPSGEVLGVTSCNPWLNSLWWVLLLVQLIGLLLIEYLWGKKHQWLKLVVYALVGTTSIGLVHYLVNVDCFTNSLVNWMVRYYYIQVLATLMFTRVISYLFIKTKD